MRPIAEVPGAAQHCARLSVVIPTYNREEALILCLSHLEAQTVNDFEVIIVDDGSTDGTPGRLEQFMAVSPLRICSVRQENAGPARARNTAIVMAKSPICVIIGDDIFGSPQFLETHLNFHQANPSVQDAAVGLTRWSLDGQEVTPFMRWLDEGGVQFSYGELLDGADASWKHFYTSNVSVKTELLLKEPFFEGFEGYGMEDIELGYRLEHTYGLRLHFLPEALAYHLHPTGLRQSCRRAYMVGKSTYVFHRRWPEQKPKPGQSFRTKVRDVLCRNTWLISPLTTAAEQLTRFWCPNPLLKFLLHYCFAAGYKSGEKR